MRESFWKTVSSEIYTSSLSCVRILLEYVLCSKGLGKNKNIRKRQSYCNTIQLPNKFLGIIVQMSDPYNQTRVLADKNIREF
jgi:hypothetical protein